MYEISIVDKNLKLKHTVSYSLSIQVNLNGFSFSVLDPFKKNVLALKHYPFRDKAIDHDDLTDKVLSCLKRDKLLQCKFKFVSFSYQTRKNTLIPKKAFRKEHLKQMLESNHDLDELDELHFNELRTVDGYNVFTVPNYLGNEFTARYNRVYFYHHATCMIGNALNRYEKNIESNVIINVNSGFFDVLVVKDKQVYLYNTFEFHSPDDLVYCVVSVFKQLHLDPEKSHIFYSGFISSNSKELHLITKFLGEVNVCPPHEQLIFSKKFHKFPLHYFTNLFNIHLCAS
jgi:hypothetical protein